MLFIPLGRLNSVVDQYPLPLLITFAHVHPLFQPLRTGDRNGGSRGGRKSLGGYRSRSFAQPRHQAVLEGLGPHQFFEQAAPTALLGVDVLEVIDLDPGALDQVTDLRLLFGQAAPCFLEFLVALVPIRDKTVYGLQIIKSAHVSFI